MAAWHVNEEDEAAELDITRYSEGYGVYDPLLPNKLLRMRLMKFVPFLPYKRHRVKANDI